MGLHVAGVGLLAYAPGAWPHVVAAVAASHAVATVAGMWPRSRLLGPNVLRLPNGVVDRRLVSLTLDDGPDAAVTPQVLDLLDRHGARATFFVVGRKAEEHPDLMREIVARGHEVGNHSHAHSNAFAFLGPRGMHREVARAQEAIAGVSGRWPRLFRAPAGIRNPFLEPVLCRLGLQLVAWSRRGFDTVTGDAAKVTQRLTTGLAAGDILLLHDGSSARDHSGRPVVLEALPRLLEALDAARLRSVPVSEALAAP